VQGALKGFYVITDLGTRSLFPGSLSAHFLSMDAITLSLILPIFRFAHRSIALKKTSGSHLEKSAKTLNRS